MCVVAIEWTARSLHAVVWALTDHEDDKELAPYQETLHPSRLDHQALQPLSSRAALERVQLITFDSEDGDLHAF